MNFVLAIVIGLIAFLAGIGLAYSLLENRLNIQEQRHRARTRREIEDVERISADRMQKRIDALKSQYETQIQQLTHQLELAHQAIETKPAIVPEEPSAPPASVASPAIVTRPVYQDLPTTLEFDDEGQDPSTEAIVEPTEAIVEPTEAIVEEPTEAPVEPTEAIVEEPTEAIVEPTEAIVEEPTEAIVKVSTVLNIAPAEVPVIPAPATSAELYLPEITLEDLKTLSYSPQVETRIQLAANLLTLLQTQSSIEFSKPFLIQVLKNFSQDPMPQLRELAVLCLSNIRSPLVVPLLRQRLQDTDAGVVKAAHQALEPWRSQGKIKPSKLTPRKLKTSKAKIG